MKESDNNAKLIVLDRLDALRSRHGHVLDSLIMDILQVLSSTDLEVRRKAISVVLSLVSSRNVEEVVLFFKKQLQRTQEQEFEKVWCSFGAELKLNAPSFYPCRLPSIANYLFNRSMYARSNSRRLRLPLCTLLWTSSATPTTPRRWTSLPLFGQHLYRIFLPRAT